jgi:transcription initiation factor TFIIH subunit 2
MPPAAPNVSSSTDNKEATAAPTHIWEATSGQSMWENAVQEDADGKIVLAAGETLLDRMRQRRKRSEQADYSQKHRRVVRDMLRYLYIVLDASRWMRDKDPALPGGTRMSVTLEFLQSFIHEYYDQNPLSHLGFVVVKDGEAEILSPLSSNAKTHKLALQALAGGPSAMG